MLVRATRSRWLRRMISALLHNLAVTGLVVALLAAPVAGMHPLGCGECATLPDLAVDSVKSHAACCASAGGSRAQSHPTSSWDCSDHGHSSLPCQLCCVATPANLPVLPASNGQRFEFGVKSFIDVDVAVDNKPASSFVARTTTGSFWTLSVDGPSRQAMLCRFTT
jgi:hypothetical protein